MTTYYMLFRNISSSDDTHILDVDSSLPVPTIESTGWTNEGYSFVEWNTARDKSGNSYAPGSNVPQYFESVLYAIWEEVVTPDVTISYNGDTIASLSGSGTEVLETDGKICEDDITITYTKPSGGGGSGANLYQFHFDIQRTGQGDPTPVLASTEKLSDYGLTPSDFLVTNTHHVAAWVDMNSGPYIIDYSDPNDDDSYSATAQSITGSMVDKLWVNKYGDVDDYNSVDLYLECIATKDNGNPFWFKFGFNTYYNGVYRDVFMPCPDPDYGFDVTNDDTYNGAGRSSYLTWIHKQSGNLVFTLNVLIFDEVSS